MSRVGKSPIVFSKEVNVVYNEKAIEISGPKGVLKREIHPDIKLVVDSNCIYVSPLCNSNIALAMWGTVRSLVNNMVIGVTVGFKTELEVVGVGYRVALKDNFINFSLGKSHSIKMFIPYSIKVSLPKQNNIQIEGFDKELVGQFIATIIKQRPVEPFKGKGIKLKDQFIKKKEGKKN
jgi:large subunit ribosomal protein L6